eukprot:TRINITY_DN1586_c0_g1_i1.p1 TRINITY_DN1586_c0_g1~~TRINITY_DN1586_c0_g1_i1.p1  ORF type:complete len:595 (+),score=79.14 TRINITY_DN1586_c0_g1_i1:72-1856(+)
MAQPSGNIDQLRGQLHGLLEALHALGRDLPQCLVSLTQVVQPQIPNEMRIPLLGKMFAEVPEYLETATPQQLQQIVRQPPADAVAFRLLLDLSQVQQILQNISYLQLLHLTNNMIPPGSPQQQLGFLSKIQEIFQLWSNETLERYNHTFQETPLHLERQQLMQLEPQIPFEMLHLLVEVLKLPVIELQAFKRWIESLPQNHLILLVNLLQMEPAVLIEVKRRITVNTEDIDPSQITGIRDHTGQIKFKLQGPGSDALSDYQARTDPTQPRAKKQKINQLKISLTREPTVVDEQMEPMHESGAHSYVSTPMGHHTPLDLGIDEPAISDILPIDQHYIVEEPSDSDMSGMPMSPESIMAVANTNTITTYHNQGHFQLRIAKQPPPKTVYQRILKPFPAVMLLGSGVTEAQSNLFVEATLMRSDSDVELNQILDGSKVIRISTGVFATFKKLKILSTSQQQGTLFRLKFQLKRYVGNVFEIIEGASVTTNPIEVFSHTQYLNERKNGPPPPPNVTEIIPTRGPTAGGTRAVILGSNFFGSPSLRMKFGETVITPTFHEQGTLICSTPAGRSDNTVQVRVANDGQEYCESYASYTYTG